MTDRPRRGWTRRAYYMLPYEWGDYADSGELARDLIRADVGKANFSPDEPRDDHGRWTTGAERHEDSAAPVRTRPHSHRYGRWDLVGDAVPRRMVDLGSPGREDIRDTVDRLVARLGPNGAGPLLGAGPFLASFRTPDPNTDGADQHRLPRSNIRLVGGAEGGGEEDETLYGPTSPEVSREIAEARKPHLRGGLDYTPLDAEETSPRPERDEITVEEILDQAREAASRGRVCTSEDPLGRGDPVLRPYGRPGGGHHVPAKKVFEGDPDYDADQALAIPNEELTRLSVDHYRVTAGQQTGYIAFAKTGARLTWIDVENIETDALIQAEMPPAMAARVVARAILDLQNAGVRNPTAIPWGARYAKP